ncbi:MAG: hypothetical protein ACE3JK_10830 [Sporolactobacillus sp.]
MANEPRAGHPLSAYNQADRTLNVLSQSEKGINALLAATAGKI